MWMRSPEVALMTAWVIVWQAVLHERQSVLLPKEETYQSKPPPPA